MRFKIIALISLGIALALAAGFGTFHYTRALETELAAVRTSLRAFGETVPVPVPKADIARGAVIRAADFTSLRLPADYLPANVLTLLPEPGEAGTFVALTDIAAGDLIFAGDLALPGGGNDSGLILAADARAFAIAPRNLADFDGMLQVGSKVDVIWTRNLGGGLTDSRLIGASLRVLALPASRGTGDPAVKGIVAGEGPLGGKLIVEGARQEALRMLQADQTGYFHILPANGSRNTATGEVVLEPGELEDLPLVVRGTSGSAASPAGALVATITGGEERRTCATAVVRAGSRSVMEVPC
ncbi:SAF domain-containing protein [Pseudogemmobacter humi]|uniref:SAF domain-containing protein n=1 Tax=Pseudogemmobacter humi TaxID=2483812 RepID=A0A3P5WR97_9RHOB|nr:SAF domain-containing protein [Pseudogemmobacter humi]VDC21156.1 hypothetical protein XINFAN_00520 [Pseudogemmobacter humi]